MFIQSVEKVDKYDIDLLDAAIARHFDNLKIKDDLFDGMKVLLKPNLLAPRHPEQVTTTHPLVVFAIAKWLRANGVRNITLADCPGGLGPLLTELKTLYSATGMTIIKDIATLNYDTECRKNECQNGFVNKSFDLLNVVTDADYIINIAKLKTHAYTIFSGGIKNIFGSIGGMHKPMLHYRFPKVEDFSNMLVELALTVKPQVTVIDAIDIMEGNGPNVGDKRHVGLTLASRDVFSQDWYAAEIIGITPEKVAMLSRAKELGLIKIDELVVKGYSAQKLSPPIKLPESVDAGALVAGMNIIMRPFQVAYSLVFKKGPAIDSSKCIGCGKCAESCPVGIIKIVAGKAEVTKKRKCISCFCCQEMCPAKAVEITNMLKY